MFRAVIIPNHYDDTDGDSKAEFTLRRGSSNLNLYGDRQSNTADKSYI